MKIEKICEKTIYYDPTKFAGWPANGGIWRWKNEILVCFHVGEYLPQEGHCIDRSKPIKSIFARSVDGGMNWTIEENSEFDVLTKKEECEAIPPQGFNFQEEGFGLKVGKASVEIINHSFVVTYDKGRTWHGPYLLPLVKGKIPTARTDYVVIDKEKCLLFLSYKENNAYDMVYIVKTEDGGRTWEYRGSIGDGRIRAVMPSTIRTKDKNLLTAIRRRENIFSEGKNEVVQKNWIELFISKDEGMTWKSLGRNFSTGRYNGNPPSLVKMTDGVIILTYAVRDERPRIVARVSLDEGKTWSDELILREDAISHDIGYTRSVVLDDNTIVTIYYFATKEMPQQHIEMTKWEIVD